MCSLLKDDDEDPDVAFQARRKGYYVIDIEAQAAVRGPYLTWRHAVREGAELNRGRIHATPLEVRLVGPPAPGPYDQDA
jgi:hypothetical protein